MKTVEGRPLEPEYEQSPKAFEVHVFSFDEALNQKRPGDQKTLLIVKVIELSSSN